MKKFMFLVLLCLAWLCPYSQSVIYFDFVTHNEETSQWGLTPYYSANRTKIINLATYFQTKGITWNMQSDWTYLTAVLNLETPVLTATTNNKNIQRYLYEDLGVEMDPHAHESQYTYPDVAKLMDSIGLPESKVMGGTIYNDSNGVNIWTNLVPGQFGIIFPAHFWQPDYMMGGGTPNHVADLKYYGIWNPQSPSTFLTHDTTSRLRQLGVGCALKVKDTTAVADLMAEIHALVNNVQSGAYPLNSWYFQTIFFEQGDLNLSTFYNKIIEIADSINAIVTTGNAEWKTMKEAYTSWETTFAAQMFQWDCGMLTSINEKPETNQLIIFPNPASDFIQFQTEKSLSAEISIYDRTGKSVLTRSTFGSNEKIDIRQFIPGIYFYQINDSVSGKLVVGR